MTQQTRAVSHLSAVTRYAAERRKRLQDLERYRRLIGEIESIISDSRNLVSAPVSSLHTENEIARELSTLQVPKQLAKTESL